MVQGIKTLLSAHPGDQPKPWTSGAIIEKLPSFKRASAMSAIHFVSRLAASCS